MKILSIAVLGLALVMGSFAPASAMHKTTEYWKLEKINCGCKGMKKVWTKMYMKKHHHHHHHKHMMMHKHMKKGK